MSSHGQFIWYDLLTPDADASKRFYSHVVGWGTQQSPGPEPYTMWENKGAPLGGIWPLQKEMGDSPRWLPYVSVDDVDETIAKATQLGGRITAGPKDIGGGGRYAVIEDPQGASLAVYRSGHSPQTPPFNPQVGQFSWHELATTDATKAFDFYSALFGWNKNGEMDMGEGGIYQMYGKGETMYGGMYKAGPDIPMSWCCYIMVDSVPEALERVKESGGKVLNGPMEVSGGSIVSQCIDPHGALFALHHAPTSSAIL